MTVITAKERYARLRSDREPFLYRARRNALLTIPSLMPLEGQGGHSHAYEPYQSVGAQGVSHLSSRLLMALLPPGRNFFRLDLPADIIAKASSDDRVRKQMTDWRQRLAGWEAAGQAVVDASNWRILTDAELQQLIVAGNVMEHMLPNDDIKLYRLDQYVVLRDYFGNLLEFIIEERMSRSSLPAEAQGLVPANVAEETDISLFTWVRKGANGKQFEVHQEVEDQEVPGSAGAWKEAELPYAALRWKVTPGEDYGRSMIEEHGGDLRSLEMLEKCLLEGSALAARNFIMIKPMATGGGLKRRIASGQNGDVLIGDFDQVKMMSFENRAGMQIAAEQAERLERRLRYAFLLNMAVQRDAERVTATEITMLVEEIENALGGVYSVLSHEMMEWRLRIMLTNLQKRKVIPKWSKGDLTPRVLTGLEALTRDRDVVRVKTAAEIIQMFGDKAMEAIEITDLLRQAFIGLGLQDVTLTRAEIAKRAEAAAQLEAVIKGLGGAIPQMAKAGMEGQAANG
jgi:hypothetical protein